MSCLIEIGPAVLKKLSIYFQFFVIISPLKKVKALFEETESPKPKDVLCQVWLKLAWWFWRRSSQRIFTIQLLHIYPIEKAHGPSFELI